MAMELRKQTSSGSWLSNPAEWRAKLDGIVHEYVEARKMRADYYVACTRRKLAQAIDKAIAEEYSNFEANEKAWEDELASGIGAENARMVPRMAKVGNMLDEVDPSGGLRKFCEEVQDGTVTVATPPLGNAMDGNLAGDRGTQNLPESDKTPDRVRSNPPTLDTSASASFQLFEKESR